MAIVGMRCAIDTLCMLTSVTVGGVLLMCDCTRQAVTVALVCWTIGSAFRPPPESVAAFRAFQLERLARIRR